MICLYKFLWAVVSIVGTCLVANQCEVLVSILNCWTDTGTKSVKKLPDSGTESSKPNGYEIWIEPKQILNWCTCLLSVLTWCMWYETNFHSVTVADYGCSFTGFKPEAVSVLVNICVSIYIWTSLLAPSWYNSLLIHLTLILQNPWIVHM